jgi:DNA-binding response OmpR family regulator
LQDLIGIMVLEDDQVIQTLVEESLTEAGFEPVIATSGEEAVTLLRGNRSHYRALVTTINLLGKMDGWEVARQAREIDPTLPIVYMTGPADELGLAGRSQQRPFDCTVRAGTTRYRVAQLLNSAPPPA